MTARERMDPRMLRERLGLPSDRSPDSCARSGTHRAAGSGGVGFDPEISPGVVKGASVSDTNTQRRIVSRLARPERGECPLEIACEERFKCLHAVDSRRGRRANHRSVKSDAIKRTGTANYRALGHAFERGCRAALRADGDIAELSRLRIRIPAGAWRSSGPTPTSATRHAIRLI